MLAQRTAKERVEIFRGGVGSEGFQETRARLDRIVAGVIREFPSKDQLAAGEIELEVLAMTGMMKEIVHGLPRQWPEDLPERVTRLFVHGISDKSRRGRR